MENADPGSDVAEFKYWTEMFLSWQALQSLRDCLKANVCFLHYVYYIIILLIFMLHLKTLETNCFDTCKFMQIADSKEWTDSIGMKLIITTCTPVQWSIQQDMEGIAASSHKVMN